MQPARRKTLLLGIALAALPLVAYGPALRGGWVWDDGDYVTDNLALRSLHGLRSIWFDLGATIQYYPLTFTSFWIDYHLWGLNTLGYHLVNIALHAATAVLFWRILCLLNVPGAWFAAAVFLLHPVHVESVAWITERKNVLSGVFALAAAWAYLRFALDPEHLASGPVAGTASTAKVAPSGLSRRTWYLLAIIAFAAALLSKTAPCPLPLALLVIIWWKRGRVAVADAVPLIPLLAMAAAMAATTAYVERTTVGASDMAWTLSASQRLLLAPRSLCFYFSKLVWPAGLCFVYPRWQIDPGDIRQYAYPAMILAAGALIWTLQRRRMRSPLAAVLIFVVLMLPVLGFVRFYYMSYSFVADHFQYLPSLSMIALLSAAGTLAIRRAAPALQGLAAASGLLILGALTWQQAGAYRDLETLWRRTIARNPTGWMPLNNLGHLLLTQGRVAEAEPHFRKAIEYHPEHGSARLNLASILAARGEVQAAIEQYEQGLRSEPNSHSGHNNLADLLIKAGRTDEAVSHLRTALTLKPDFALAHCNLGIALAALNQPGEAIAHLEKSVQLDPQQAGACYSLAAVLADVGRTDEAEDRLRQALTLKPDYAEAHHDLAVLLAAQGRSEEAITHFRQSLRLNPGQADAHFNLARALQERGQRDEAIREYAEALRINPQDAEARKALDVLTSKTP